MDQQKRRQIKELVFKACTKSTGEQIDTKILGNIKKLCKQSEECLDCAYEQLWHSLKNKSSQIRFYALLVVNELFCRSAKFRQQLVEHFQEFIALTVTGNEDKAKKKKTKKSRQEESSSTQTIVYDLPPPHKYATLLRDTALRLIEEWEEKYGDKYNELRIGYQYLKNVCKLRMPNLREQRERIERRQEERAEFTRQVALLKYDRVKSEFDENIVPLGVHLQQMDICFKMIVPEFEDLFGDAFQKSDQPENEPESSAAADEVTSILQAESIAEKAEDDGDDWEDVDLESHEMTEQDVISAIEAEEAENNDNTSLLNDGYEDLNHFILSTGLGSSGYEITVEHSLDNLKNADNTLAYDLLQEGLVEMKTKYQPLVKEWLSVLTAVSLPENTPAIEKQKKDQIMRVTIDVKERINACIRKCEELKVKSQGRTRSRYSVPQIAISNKRKTPTTTSTSATKRRKLQ